MTPPRSQSRLLDAAEAIRLDPDKAEAAFLARQLVQATLPHKDPGNAPIWKRTNGNLTLTIRPGWDHSKDIPLGFPYGTIPRLLLFWITTEALRTNNRRLELGKSLDIFMHQLGLNPDNGSPGAKRSDARRLRDQMRRLFRAVISFDRNGQGKEAWLDMQIAPEGVLWWDDRQPNQPTLWESWIELSQKFFEAVTASPVPVDIRALKALKHSPLALDLYTWATYTAYQTQKSGKVRSISWELLHKQFGADYTEVRNFQTKAWITLKKIKTVYPDLSIERERGGVRILPCNPAITIKGAKRPKAVNKESY